MVNIRFSIVVTTAVSDKTAKTASAFIGTYYETLLGNAETDIE